MLPWYKRWQQVITLFVMCSYLLSSSCYCATKKWWTTICCHLPFVLPWCYKWRWITQLFIIIISLFMLRWHCRWRRVVGCLSLFSSSCCLDATENNQGCTPFSSSSFCCWLTLNDDDEHCLSSFSSSFCLVPKNEKKNKFLKKWIKKIICVF